MSRFVRSEDFHRAIQLMRWIEMQDVLPIRTRGMVLRSLTLITRPGRSSRHVPEEAPLAGLDPRGFLEQLHRPEGGVVADVIGIGPATIEALRAALPSPNDLTVPTYSPPTSSRSDSPFMSDDLIDMMLNELWACLGDEERRRLVALAADLVIERVYERETLASMKEKGLAEAVKRQLAEMRSAGGRSATRA